MLGLKSTARSMVQLSALCLAIDPTHDRCDYMLLFFMRKLAACFDVVPFRETAAAARSGGVLSNEYRVSAERRLLAVVAWRGRCQALRDKITCMREDNCGSFVVDIREFLWTEGKAPAKTRFGESSEQIVEVLHYEKN